jgi:hypothetical protein
MRNELGLPQPFVDAVSGRYSYTPKRYSVTRVLGGTCEAVLGKRHGDETDTDVADMVWAIFGSAVHKILEEASESDTQIKENKLAVELPNGYTLSGIFDLYDDATGTVTDYKTCSVWKVKFGEFDDWRSQTLMYCWLLRRCGFDARAGEIVAIMKDHSKRDAKFKAADGYPPHPVHRIRWDFTQDDFDEVEQRITDWFDEVAEQEALPDDELVPCSPEQRWRRDDKWAVKKGSVKKAVRVFDSPEEADAYIEGREGTFGLNNLWVEHRPGEDAKCEGYCDVRAWCPYYRAMHGDVA